MRVLNFWLLSISIILLGWFSGCNNCYDDGGFRNVTNFIVKPDLKTPKGIKIDSSGLTLEPAYLGAIDGAVDDVEACLKLLYPNGQLGTWEIDNGHCLRDSFDPNFHRECLNVKIAQNSHVGCYGEEVFPCSVDPQLCVDKGQTVTASCPCECRSAIQDENTIVVTPDLALLKADVIRMQTSCNYVWFSGLEECVLYSVANGGIF